MSNSSASPAAIRNRALALLRDRLRETSPGIEVDPKGYCRNFRENLLPMVTSEDFEQDLRAGDGNELETKFRAAHSSSALAVNSFAPMRGRLRDVPLFGGEVFESLRFEQKCPSGLRGGRSPNLDVLLTGQQGVVGVESKLTEYLGRHDARFSAAYRDQIKDWRREQAYFQHMLELMETPDRYRYLDAAQLIKHGFGLAHTHGTTSRLLYLYWEPLNPECDPVFERHRKEIAAFAARVAGSTPAFSALSYDALWDMIGVGAPDWLLSHIGDLRSRYSFRI